jgi:sulfur-carrier protein
MPEAMLRIRFFAAIREKTGRAALELAVPEGVVDVATLIAHLDRVVLPGSAATLLAENTLVAVNRSVCGVNAPISDGDEIAFYPPVTGG